MSRRPNVILLIFDTLRADAPSCYDGAFDVETPAIDSVADSGTLFENAFAAGSFTPPSHGSMFSGQHPSSTGFLGAWPTMPNSVPLLAEHLSEAGYETFGVAGPAKMGIDTGLDRGFDGYYEAYKEVAERPSLAYLRQLLTDPLVRRDFVQLATRGNDYYTKLRFGRLTEALADLEAPFFAMANLTTVHAPYDPPRPYKREATPELTRPRVPLFEELFDDPGTLDRDGVREERTFAAADGRDSKVLKLRYHDDETYLSSEELDVLRAWYGASLRYLDHQLGRFVSRLDDENQLADTLLILTADHGECFGEHGALYHGTWLYDEITHVPLIVSGPGVEAGHRRSDPASLVDLFDTICDLCDVDPPESTEGRSLFGGPSRDAVYAEESVSDASRLAASDEVSEATRHEVEIGRKSIRTADHRYELRSDGTERLYAYPGERLVRNPDSELVSDLRRRLVDELGETFHRDDEADPEYGAAVERNLRDLGYRE